MVLVMMPLDRSEDIAINECIRVFHACLSGNNQDNSARHSQSPHPADCGSPSWRQRRGRRRNSPIRPSRPPSRELQSRSPSNRRLRVCRVARCRHPTAPPSRPRLRTGGSLAQCFRPARSGSRTAWRYTATMDYNHFFLVVKSAFWQYRGSAFALSDDRVI